MSGTLALFVTTALAMAPTQPPDSTIAAREKAIELASAALAEIPGIERAQIELEQVRAVEFADTSLGCAEKGKVYNPVIVPGFVVELRALGQLYAVHVGAGRAVVCEATLAPWPAERAGTKREGLKLYLAARADLAKRLKADPEAIRLRTITPRVWPDAGLGCPEPGATYSPAPTPGFSIELEHADEVHRYHTDSERVRLCPEPEPEGSGEERGEGDPAEG